MGQTFCLKNFLYLFVSIFEVDQIDGNRDSIFVDKLEPGNHYILTVSSVANDQVGAKSKEIEFWTLPAVVQNLNVNFGVLEIEVWFEPAPGGVEYYDITIAPKTNPSNIIDVRQLKKNEYFRFNSKSQFLKPEGEYVVTVTTFSGPDGFNSVKKDGKMKDSPVPIIENANVDNKDTLR